MRWVPDDFGVFYEPFLGSGALFFHLAGRDRIHHGAFLSDANAELVNAYRHVRDCPNQLAAQLEAHISAHNIPYFHELRLLDRTEASIRLSGLARAARFIYLANAAFQGGWRVDRAGRVTSKPRSDGRPLHAVALHALMDTSAALRTACVTTQDFRAALSTVSAGDLVFLDPPYVDTGSRKEGSRYTAERFTASDAADLVGVFRLLAARAATVVLCAQSKTTIRALQEFRILPTSNRRAPSEVLITSAQA